MLRTKADVDRHVAEILKKVRSEREKNLKCYNIALLYYKVRDYESAKLYVSMYLMVKEDAPLANKLLGQIYEALGQKERALAAYKTSLEYENNQPDLVLKICELMCETDVTLDADRARYWCERGSEFFPHDPVIFRLKERLLTMSNGNANSEAFEQLIYAELKARPADVNVRIRLLKLYLDTHRVKAAYSHAVELESRQTFRNELVWYECFSEVCKTYYEQCPTEVDWEFYVHWVSVLDRAARLTLMEGHGASPTSVADCVQAVFNLDQALFKAASYNTSSTTSPASEFYKEFLKHMSAQLYLHMATLTFKKAKNEHSNWKEASQSVAPLLFLAMAKPVDIEAVWIPRLKTNLKKFINVYKDDSYYRVSQAGYVLLGLAKKETGNQFIKKVMLKTSSTNMPGESNWRERLFQRLFSISDHRAAMHTSHLVHNPLKEKLNISLPVHNAPPLYVFELVPVFERIHLKSLHHMVWLGVQVLRQNNYKLPPDFHTYSFTNLQVAGSKLSMSVESLNRLDIDAFLYLTVFCANSILEEEILNGYHSTDRPLTLPADISNMLCTLEQADWWGLACGVYRQNFKNDSDFIKVRQVLQQGIEVLRIVGNHGLDVQLIVKLARTFSERASYKQTDNALLVALEERANMYWSAAIPLLEKIQHNQSIRSPVKCLFNCPKKDLSPAEVSSLLEEGRYFVACQLMKEEEHERAIEAFKVLRSPLASFNQALIYKKLAEAQYDTRPPEDITSEMRSKYIILLTKARDCLRTTKERIRLDKRNSLHTALTELFEEVESALIRIEPDYVHRRDDSLASDVSVSSVGSPVGEVPVNVGVTRQNGRPHHTFNTSTPLRTHGHGDFKRQNNSAEYVEVGQLLQIQMLIDQNKKIIEKLDSLTTKVDSLCEDVKKMKPAGPEDLYIFGEEEDYGEDVLGQYPGNFSTPYQPLATPHYYPTRGVQGTSTLTYGAPPIPPQAPQFYSPRVESALAYQPPVQTPLGAPPISFYNQNALPFSEGQQLPDFMRTSSLPKQPVPPINVVITMSDTLPTGPPPIQPPMSVTIPPQHRLGTIPTPIPAPVPTTPPVHNFQIAMPASANIPSVEKSPILAQEEFESDEESDVAERDPYPDFQPIIPLPDEVVVRTGEESETVLFENRAKLYRHVDKEWKERGVGMLKILKDEANGKIRVLMRREQVLKICANHLLKSDMELTPLKNSNCAYVWVANDFADGTVKLETLCAKFKTVEEALKFKDSFNEAKKTCSTSPVKPKKDSDVEKETEKTKSDKIVEQGKVSFGGFTFSSTPTVRTVEKVSNKVEEKKDTQPASSPFASFTFKAAQTNSKLSSSTPSTDTEVPKFGSLLRKPLLSVPPKSEASVTQPKSILKDSVLHSETPTKTQPFVFSPSTGDKPQQKHVLFQDSTPETAAIVINESKSPSLKELLTSTDTSNVLDFASFSKMNDTIPDFIGDSDGDSKIQFKGAGSMVFGQQIMNSENETTDDFVPTAEFKPVVPLPDLVEVKTGEEGQEILFEERSKLYRFDSKTKEWKERGVGKMKILKDPITGVARFLMRREQVLKICCNHRISSGLEIKSHLGSDKAWTWHAQDYTEGEMRSELFVLRFKNSDQAKAFKDVVDKVLEGLTSPSSPAVVANIWKCSCLFPNSFDSSVCRACKKPKPRTTSVTPKFSEWRTKPVGWECSHCYTINEAKEKKCVDCESVPTVIPTLTGKTGSWHCQDCHLSNEPTASICSACGANKSPTEEVLKPLSEMFKSKPGSWSCTACLVSNDAKDANCLACETPKLATEKPKPNEKSLAEMFKPKTGSWECSGCLIRNDADKTICPACSSPKQGHQAEKGKSDFTFASSSFSFGIPTNESSKSGFNFEKPANTLFFGETSNFGLNKSENSNFSFGITPSGDSSNETKKEEKKLFNFGSLPSGSDGFRFTSVAAETGIDSQKQFGLIKGENKTGELFAFGASGKSEFTFAGIRSPKSPAERASESEPDEVEEDEGDHIHFQPIVPLPDKIDVKTGEEEEEVLYSHRSKLYRYTGGEWKERGVGDIKILRNFTTKKIRLLMRREPIMKLCLNHYLTTELNFRPKDNRAWFWTALDYAEEELKAEQFCLRFKTSDIALEFKAAIDSAQNELGTRDSDDGINSNNSAITVVPTTESPAMKAFSFNVSPSQAPTSLFSLSSQFGQSVPGSGPSGKSIFGGTSQSEKDVEVLYENDVTAEEKEAALKLQLPPKFYSYRRAPPCPGCVGCEADDDDTKPAAIMYEVCTEPTAPPAGASVIIISKTAVETKPATSTTTVDSTSSSPLLGTPSSTFKFAFNTTTSADTQYWFSNSLGSNNIVTNSEPMKSQSLFGSQSGSAVTTTTSSPQSNLIFGSRIKDSEKEASKNIFGGTQKMQLPSSTTEATKCPPIFGSLPSFGETQKQASVFGIEPSVQKPFFGAGGFTKSEDSSKSIFGGTSSIVKTDTVNLKPFSFGSVPNQQCTESQFSFGTSPNTETKSEGTSSFSFAGSSLFSGNSGTSFAQIAADNNSTAFEAGKKNFSWASEGKGSPLFITTATTPNEGESSGDEADPDQLYDPHFEPIVPLPATIKVTTGEEEEDREFCNRAKLFRFNSNTKEWKERGVGEMKILKHPINNTYRLLMRREQVHKVVCNHLLTETIEMNMMTNSETSLTWGAMNLSDETDTPQPELLAVKFKTVEICLQFKAKVDECIQKVVELKQAFNASDSQACSSLTGDATAVEKDVEEEDYEDNDVNDDDYYDEDDEEQVFELLFQKPVTLFTRVNDDTDWATIGEGDLQILYDSDVFGSRIFLKDYNDELLFNSIISGDSLLTVDGKDCLWIAEEGAHVMARFQTEEAAEEFKMNFCEGVNFAEKALI